MPAHWARVVVFQPWFETVWMEDVPTRHEHCFFANSNVFGTNRTRWILQLAVISLLAMFLLDFLYWQLFDSFCISWLARILFLLSTHLLDEFRDVVKEVWDVLMV